MKKLQAEFLINFKKISISYSQNKIILSFKLISQSHNKVKLIINRFVTQIVNE